MRRLDEMARHFRLGTVMSAHYGGRGQVEWEVWLSGWYIEHPGETKAVSRGINGQVKEEAASELMRMLWEEIEPKEATAALVAETEPAMEMVAAMLEEPVEEPIEQQVQLGCAICEDFVAESSYATHVDVCFRQRTAENEARHREKVAELEESVERLRQIALTCLVCYEDASSVRPNVFIGAMVCGHTVCNRCLERLPKDPRAKKRRCPTC